MIVSHGVKGLLDFEQFPPWGLIPVHLVTKISSTLFILVFGLSLAIAYVPNVGRPDWPARRLKLLLRGVKVFFWYKVLTIVEMFSQYSPEEILAALQYRAFPVYVEILDFYAIALLWIPFVLPLWARSPRLVRLFVPVGIAVLSVLLSRYFNFFGSEALKTLLMESEDHYCWGQLSRAPLVALGLLLGAAMRSAYGRRSKRLALAGGLLAGAVLLFGAFWWSAGPHFHAELMAIALNVGKHPPEPLFMLFSGAGALFVLALALAGGERLARAAAPITAIGRDALQAFNCHIFVIFIFYRYLLGFWHTVTYLDALKLTAILIALTAVWVKAVHWIQAKSSAA